MMSNTWQNPPTDGITIAQFFVSLQGRNPTFAISIFKVGCFQTSRYEPGPECHCGEKGCN